MTRFEPGGTERQMIELIRRLDPSRWRVYVACFEKRGAWLGRVAEAAQSIDVFPVTSFKRASVVGHARHFAAWCRLHRVAVVHTTELYANIFGLPAAALAGVPARIGNRREINPDKTPAQIALQRAAYACANRVVANSNAAAQRLRDEYLPLRRIAVVPNGVAAATRSRPRCSTPGRHVVVVANLRKEKGHDVLIDAAARVVRAFPDARFHLVGDGPERDALEAQTARLGLGEAVRFHGHCEDVAEHLSAADFFVLPSRSEALPNALLEAMASGLPAVASAVGGIPELITDGVNGLLVPPGQAEPLADRIERLMSNPSLADRLGREAGAIADARYSFDRMVASFESIYLDALAS